MVVPDMEKLVAADVCVGGAMQNIEERLIHKYEKILLEAKLNSPKESEVTIFDTAFRKHHENPTTELLAFFIDPNEVHDLGLIFYDGFISSLKDISDELNDLDFGGFQKIGIEQTVADQKRIDLWLESEKTLILVELKINHEQNNPVLHYEAWGKKEAKDGEKHLIKLVVSLDGITKFKNWYSISYSHLAKHIRTTLSKSSVERPLSKWTIFAREFLLHLVNLKEVLETDMNTVEFVIKNNKEIQELFILREKAYKEIEQHVLNEYGAVFEEKNYKVVSERRDKKEAKAWRFQNTKFKSSTDIALYLYFDAKPSSEVWLCFDLNKKNQEIVKTINTKVRRGKYKNHINARKSNEQTDENYLSICWEFNDFNLLVITELIIENQKLLNQIELG